MDHDQVQSNMESKENMDGPIENEEVVPVSDSESDALSAPPGFEPTFLISPSGFEDWQQIKETQSEAVREREKHSHKQKRGGKSKGRTSLKLKDRIQAVLKGGNKRRKDKKLREIGDATDIEWSGGEGDSEEDDIEHSESKLERIWRIGAETGLVAQEEEKANKYLRNKEEEAATQRRGRETKRTRARRSKATSK
ncbi:hypothetical protein PIB30_054466, partial [Stylosanthes scabra]|nr:hypothetical protein [Stylosanthes scabra]